MFVCCEERDSGAFACAVCVCVEEYLPSLQREKDKQMICASL